MAETDELADLRAYLKRLERRHAEEIGRAERRQRLLIARILVLVCTAALLLAVSMPWYSELDNGEETFTSVSGWRLFSLLASSSGQGALVFAGWFSWLVVLGALAAGVSALQLTQRWLAATMSTVLALLTAGHLLLNAVAVDSVDGQRLAATWCALLVMAASAFAWGNLVRPLRDLAADPL
ncbi:hypothetical protein [Actinophytocola sp.]|jgi:hypothetical protein|uniref:hypothetical protein n=1 Tax=Actinophytocola sp. TaxID=1872138 RepID=UPI002EDAC56C